MQDKEKDLQIYELGFHILPSVSESDLPEAFSKLKSVIIENGGAVISEGFPRTRSLSYPISACNKAYFGWIKFEAPKENIKKIEQIIKNDSQMLRFILVKTVKENTIHYFKFSAEPEKDEREPVKQEVKEINQEEIDKSIEELVIN